MLRSLFLNNEEIFIDSENQYEKKLNIAKKIDYEYKSMRRELIRHTHQYNDFGFKDHQTQRVFSGGECQIGEKLTMTIGDLSIIANLSAAQVEISCQSASLGSSISAFGKMLRDGLLLHIQPQNHKHQPSIKNDENQLFKTNKILVQDNFAPVLGQRALGLNPSIPRSMSPSLEMFYFMNQVGKSLGRLYSKDPRFLNVAQSMIYYGQEYALKGHLLTLQDLNHIKKSVFFYVERQNQYLPMCYIPINEYNDCIDDSNTIKGLNINFVVKNKLNLNQTAFIIDKFDESETEESQDIKDFDFKYLYQSAVKDVVYKPGELCSAVHIRAGSIDANASSIITDGIAHIESTHGDIVWESGIERRHNGSNYQEHKISARLEAGKSMLMKSAQNLILKSIDLASRGETVDTQFLLKATGHIFDIALMEQATTTYMKEHEDGYSTVTETWHTAKPSSYHNLNGAINFEAGETYVACGINVRSKIFDVMAAKGLQILDAHDYHTREETRHQEGSGLFSQDKTIQSMESSQRSVGADFGLTKVSFTTHEGDIELTHVHAEDITVRVENGRLRLFQGRNSSQSQTSSQGKGLLWQSQGIQTESHDTFSDNHITNLTILEADGVDIEIVRGECSRLLSHIQETYKGDVNCLTIEEIHKTFAFNHSGPTAALSIMVALAVTLATAGTGASSAVAASIGFSKGVMATAVAAGFTCACSSAALSLVQNKGHLGKSLKAFASKETLKSLALSMVTAGVVHGLSDYFNLPSDISKITEFKDHVSSQAINMCTKMAAEATIYGRTDGGVGPWCYCRCHWCQA